MIKYTASNQLTLSGFKHPFEEALSEENRWVRLAKVIPWDSLAAVYIKRLSSNSGRESIDVRMVIGAIIVKHKLGLNDRDTVDMISENIYLQYFCGLTSFQTKKPFHPTVLVDIRKRMGASDFDAWNVLVIEKSLALKKTEEKETEKQSGQEDDENDKQARKAVEKKEIPSHKGSLKIDATVADQKIVYPTDSGLLNAARKESERIIDQVYKQLKTKRKKPRDYRRIARKEYLGFSKNRKKRKKTIRKFIRKQLNYLKRNLMYIKELLDSKEIEQRNTESEYKFPLTKRDQRIYWVIQVLYEQQQYMHLAKVKKVEDRIVSIYQPYVRPIVRGKDKKSVEFGAKISASESDGMSRVERISWDNFNESKDLILQVEAYHQAYDYYPELLLADQIYLTRANRKWLKEKGIRIVGKTLGRPAKQTLSATQKRTRKKEQNQRNLIEGKFGQAKNAYGLNHIQAKRKDTSESWIGAIFFVMNLISLLKIADKLAIFYAFFKNLCFYVFAPLLQERKHDFFPV